MRPARIFELGRGLPAALGVLSCIAGVASSAAADGPTRLRAERIEVRRDGSLRASGGVRLELGRPGGVCRLSADELRLGAARDVEGDLLVAEQVRIAGRAGEGALSAHRLRLGRDNALAASWLRAELCGCGGGLTLTARAREAWVDGRGQRLHLRWPRVAVGRLPLLVAPYWAVPLRPGTSGLLWPRLGYSERDGLRLEQGGLVASRHADLTLAGGWHQGRGGHLRSRVQVFGNEHGDGRIALFAVSDQGRWRASGRGFAVVRGQRWHLALWPDLVSDELLLRDTADAAHRVFAPYLRSRLLAHAAGGPLTVTATTDLLHDMTVAYPGVEGGVAASSATGTLDGLVVARALLAPVRVAGPLLLLAESRWVNAGGAATLAESRGSWLSLFELSPALALSQPVGPLRLTGLARYLLQSRAQRGEAVDHGHLLAALSEVGLPLARRFAGGSRHVLEPFAGWRVAAGHRLQTADGRWLAPREAGVGLAGLRTRLSRADGRASARAHLALGLGERLRVGVAELAAGRPWLRIEAGSVVAASSDSSVGSDRIDFDLWGRVCTATSASRLSVCGGYLRHRLGLAELLSADPASWGASWTEAPWLWHPATTDADDRDGRSTSAVEAVDQVHLELRARPWRALEAAAAIHVDPVTRQLTHGTYRLSLQLGCGCYRLSLLGRSRRDQRWPDVMAQLSLGLRAPACLAR